MQQEYGLSKVFCLVDIHRILYVFHNNFICELAVYFHLPCVNKVHVIDDQFPVCAYWKVGLIIWNRDQKIRLTNNSSTNLKCNKNDQKTPSTSVAVTSLFCWVILLGKIIIRFIHWRNSEMTYSDSMKRWFDAEKPL